MMADESDMPDDKDQPEQHDSAPCHRSCANDGDMGKLVVLFLQELSDRMTALKNALESGDEERIRCLSSQLKGSAARYGDPSISEIAAVLERTIIEEEANLSMIEERVEELIALCRRATQTENLSAEGRAGEAEF